ncbi:hypothetical protein BDW42DRAFT_163450 [Aspergillus taichungensis]|uniref:Uncharacterized protein n=1 Tax=Aspergillus taichungensis TaxID=482145 RepID=A0A2J5I2H8_9EURO|nr:hypothetical protein BDW42DRAFT_163450 [Aspergillus taichungensis]
MLQPSGQDGRTDQLTNIIGQTLTAFNRGWAYYFFSFPLSHMLLQWGGSVFSHLGIARLFSCFLFFFLSFL